MYEFILNEIKKKLVTEEKKYISTKQLKNYYILLLYLKYICQNKNINDYYNKDILLSNISIDKEELYKEFFTKNINELLIYFQTDNIYELTKEFIDKENYDIFRDIDNIFIKEEDNTLYYFNISDKNNKILFYRTDYVTKVKLYEMLDEITNTYRKYEYDFYKVELDEIDNLIIIDDEPVYKYIQGDNIIDKISNIFFDNRNYKGNIILKTTYSKISKLKSDQLLSYLTKVCIYENNQDAVLVFRRANDLESVSIVMIKDNIYNNIKEIITKNEENKEYLLKVSKSVIKSNNYRIGFNMYLPNRTEDVKSINDIIDENTKITEEISRLNKLIQQEMDKLISK